MIRRLLIVLAAFALLAAAAVAHGLRTDRWGPPTDLKAAADRLAAVPAAVGDWRGEGTDLDPRMVEAARAAGHLDRRYTRFGKNDVTVLVLCGRPGPISVHTPDVCYRGAGYVPGPRTTQTVDGHSFWVSDFVKDGPKPDKLRILWAWSDGGPWEAAAHERTQYAGGKVLYKLYVIRQLTDDKPADGKAADAPPPEVDLLKAFLPELEKAIRPTP